MADQTPPQVPEGQGQESGEAPAPKPVGSAPLAGKRQALRNLVRTMSDAELTAPGTVKLLIDDLEQAEAEREYFKAFVERYHAADKDAAVLTERLKPAKALDVMFGVGVGLGGAILGLAPFFWERGKDHQAVVACLLGVALIIGATIGRMVQR